jgi:hypothetical protein
MQTAEWPWETWVVLPFFWLLLLWGMTRPRCPDQDPEGGREAHVIPPNREGVVRPALGRSLSGHELTQTTGESRNALTRERTVKQADGSRSLGEPQETVHRVWALSGRDRNTARAILG